MGYLRCLVLCVALSLVMASLAGTPATVAGASSPALSSLDQYAGATPAAVERTLDDLVAYLVQPAHSDAEKARLIFCWIAAHIDYDVVSFRSGAITDTSAEAVLAHRKTICDGYANLYCAMAVRAGLTALKIPGYARGIDIPLGRNPHSSNHAWNAVQLNGRWQLLDSTWGAGHVEGIHFTREYDAFFFLTPPAQFIYTHFPDEARWQLLAAPVSRATFDQWPDLKSPFFKCRLHLDSHQTDHLTMPEAVKITFTAETPIELQAQLESADIELPRDYCFTQREGDRYAVYVRFPAAGKYQLVIFARDAAAPRETKLREVVTYHITASAGSADNLMPKRYGSFPDHNVSLTQPWNGVLTVGTAVMFELTVPGATHVLLISNGKDWVEMTRVHDDHFKQQLQIVPGSIAIGAQFEASNSYVMLLEYKVK